MKTSLKTWTKRVAAVAVVGLGAVALTAPSAEAGTLTATLTVQTTVTPACTAFSGGTMSFPSYVSGQVTTDTTSFNFGITCPGATAAVPDFVTVTLAPSGGAYSMASGANTLAYGLYSDSGYTTAWAPAAAQPFTINTGAATTVPVYGQIAANLTPAAGAYSQTVNATLTF